MQKGDIFNYKKLIDFNLNRLLSVFSNLNNINTKLNNVIHIAGTNGKGSTTAFLKSILQHCGYSVNVFTSPHLVNFNERIYIKNNFISNTYLAQLQNQLKQTQGSNNLSLFETTFVLATMAFIQNPADFTILEVGLGGRLDATNVVTNTLVSAISHIDYDHEDFLGNTLSKIAYEKACIIKPNSVAVKSYQQKKVLNVFSQYASSVNANLLLQNTHYYIKRNVLYYNNFTVPLKLSLLGKHQQNNASLAIVTAIKAMQLTNKNFNINHIVTALNNTTWPARLQPVTNIYNYSNTIYLDGAHNPNGAKVLSNFILSNVKKYNHVDIIFGMLEKKHLNNFLLEFVKLNNTAKTKNLNFKLTFYPTPVPNNSSYSSNQILQQCVSLGLACRLANFTNCDTIITDHLQHIQQTNKQHNRQSLTIICGSLYLIGHIMGQFKHIQQF